MPQEYQNSVQVSSHALTMVSYPPHAVTSNDTASTIVSGDQSRKPGQTGRKHNPSTDAARDDPIINTKRPSFGQWLKAALPDLLTMIIVGAVGLGVSQASLYSARCWCLTDCTGLLGTTRSQPLVSHSLPGRNDRFPRIRLSTPARSRPDLGRNINCHPSTPSRDSDHADTNPIVLGCQ